MKQNSSDQQTGQEKSSVLAPLAADSLEFTPALRQVVCYNPADIKAPNHNDVKSFIHLWFAGFDHIAPAEFFLSHFDDADMTFNMDGQVLAHDHQSFKDWFADALLHIPWDYHDILDIIITGTFQTGWATEFFIRHVGEWHDIPLNDANTGQGRPFNRIIRANWKLEHNGEKFTIRRYELSLP